VERRKTGGKEIPRNATLFATYIHMYPNQLAAGSKHKATPSLKGVAAIKATLL